MPIDPDVRAALEALDARITQTRNQAQTAIAADRVRLGALEEAARRLRRALRDGRFDGDEGTLVDALAAALGLSVRDLQEALAWVTQERRKARR